MTEAPAPQAPPGYRYLVEDRGAGVARELLSSKKFVAVLLGVAITAASSLGLEVDAQKLDSMIQLLMVYLGAQGVADAGKSFAQVRSGK